jgi:hypothetical protein
MKEKQKKIRRINETKSWLFEKINKMDRPLENLTKRREEKPKSVKSETQKGDKNKCHGNRGNGQ